MPTKETETQTKRTQVPAFNTHHPRNTSLVNLQTNTLST